jgi:Uma2 family endonuclease
MLESVMTRSKFTPKRWSAREYDALVTSGALNGLKVELLDGVIVEMTPQGGKHVGAVHRLGELLTLLSVGKPFGVIVQTNVDFGSSRPEPDLALVPRSELNNQVPTRALLVVEVAESTVRDDRAKAEIYARANVPEYWLVDVEERVIEVRTCPVPGEGKYEREQLFKIGETILSVAVPELSLAVARAFGAEQ